MLFGSDGEVGDRPELRGGIDEVGVDRVGEHAEQSLRLGAELSQFGGRGGQGAAPDVDLMGGAEPLRGAGKGSFRVTTQRATASNLQIDAP